MYQITKEDKRELSPEELKKITHFKCYKINKELGEGICAIYLKQENNKALYEKLNKIKPFDERKKITYYSPSSF